MQRAVAQTGARTFLALNESSCSSRTNTLPRAPTLSVTVITITLSVTVSISVTIVFISITVISTITRVCEGAIVAVCGALLGVRALVQLWHPQRSPEAQEWRVEGWMDGCRDGRDGLMDGWRAEGGREGGRRTGIHGWVDGWVERGREGGREGGPVLVLQGLEGGAHCRLPLVSLLLQLFLFSLSSLPTLSVSSRLRPRSVSP